MSNPRQFLIVDSPEHGEVADEWVCNLLRENFGTICNCWSGIWVKPGLLSDTYAIYWGAPVSQLFGDPPSEDNPDGDPLLNIVEETFDANGESEWQLLVPPPVEDPLP